jgi:DNA-binding LacI/PurR family transcriptional regulator
MSTTERQRLGAAQIRRIAVEAACDPRTVARYLHGEKVAGVARERIERALVALGHGGLVRAE